MSDDAKRELRKAQAQPFRAAKKKDKTKSVDAAATADKLREKGYTVRRNRHHAATPPPEE